MKILIKRQCQFSPDGQEKNVIPLYYIKLDRQFKQKSLKYMRCFLIDSKDSFHFVLHFLVP